eukprot:CAMPEP_0185207000 /NCGR_PEP_ID=MMETSP1140-20130426/59513_1 /TAXON_ID=298111 /ORGANISM="Pavlova sp., Strain CCMP459" /LENGTH=38 /DNA_ID= /DNA_START= /DNA_END= /DNA_ORIENTATION=
MGVSTSPGQTALMSTSTPSGSCDASVRVTALRAALDHE